LNNKPCQCRDADYWPDYYVVYRHAISISAISSREHINDIQNNISFAESSSWSWSHGIWIYNYLCNQ